MVVVWFHKGLMMGTGEGGLPFYTADNLSRLFSYAWVDATTGSVTSLPVMSMLFFYYVSFLASIGIPAFLIQALSYFALMMIAAMSVYGITKSLMPKVEDRFFLSIVPFSAALFYLVNSAAMVNVWNRGLLTFTAHFVFLPLAAYLFLEGMRKRQLRYALYLALSPFLVTVFGQHPLSSPAFVYNFFFVMVSLILGALVISSRNRSKSVFVAKFSAIFVGLLILCNVWWSLMLLPGIRGPITASTGAQPLAAQNLSTLMGISNNQFKHVENIMFLKHDYFFSIMSSTWTNLYNELPFLVLSLVIVILVFIPIVSRYRNYRIAYFSIFAIFSIFLAKGALPPFDNIFLWMFTSLPLFDLYRNSFEKGAFLLMFAYAPLFGIGVGILYRKLPDFLRIVNSTAKRSYLGAPKFLSVATIFLICGVQAWPMYTGYVFLGSVKPYSDPDYGSFVIVPNYYSELKEYLKQDTSQSRILSLPVTGDGVPYSWPKGYSGVELSNDIYVKPTVAALQGVPYIDEIMVRAATSTGSSSFWKLLLMLDINYIILRNDIDRDRAGLPSYETTYEQLFFESSFTSESLPTVKGNIRSLIVNNSDLSSRIAGNWLSPEYRQYLDENDTIFSNPAIVLEDKLAHTGEFNVLNQDYYLSEAKDISNAKFIHLWIKSSVSGFVMLALQDADGSSIGWAGRENPVYSDLAVAYQIGEDEINTWKHFEFLASIPNERYKPPFDYGNLTKIGVTVLSKDDSDAVESFKIGAVIVDEGRHNDNYKYYNQVGNFGELTLLKYTGQDPDRIYTVKTVAPANDLNEMIFDKVLSADFDPLTVAYAVESQNDPVVLEQIREKNSVIGNADIEYEYIKPGHYKVHVKDAVSPFVIIQADSYRSSWQIVSLPSSEWIHFVANGFANGWLIEKTGTYSFDIYFNPQSYLEAGALISAATSVGALSVILYVNRAFLKRWMLRN
jgi:hypothetical protein